MSCLASVPTHASSIQWQGSLLPQGFAWTSLDRPNQSPDGLIAGSRTVNGLDQVSVYNIYSAQFTLLGGLQGHTYGNGISANGRYVVGTGFNNASNNYQDGTRAVLSVDGQPVQVLPTLGGNNANAADVNNAGQVVGTSTRADGSSAAFIYQNGQMSELLPSLPGAAGGSSASHINDAGDIAGDRWGQFGLMAFVIRGGQIEDISLGGNNSAVWGLNQAGWATGYAFLAGSDPDMDAFVHLNGQTLNLDGLVSGLGLVDTQYAYFNWDGDLIGLGSDALGNERWFQLSALQVSEPGALLLAGAGLLGAALARRRRVTSKA